MPVTARGEDNASNLYNDTSVYCQSHENGLRDGQRYGRQARYACIAIKRVFSKTATAESDRYAITPFLGIFRRGQHVAKRIYTAASVPLMRLAHPLAFAGFLRSIGAPVDSAFHRARLPRLSEDPNAYVPVYSVRLFFEDMCQREVEALGWEAGRWAQENHIHQGLLRRLAAAPTLARALKEFSALVSMENSHYRLGLFECGEEVMFWAHDANAADTAGYYAGSSYALYVMLAIIRHFAGASWLPAEVGIEAPALPDGAREILPGTRILTRQKMSYLRLPRIFLSLPPEEQWAVGRGDGNAENSLMLTDSLNFTQTLQLVLESYLAGGCPSAEQTAALIGTSSRTLRRRLISEGITYSELVDKVRFEAARRLLNEPAAKMIDIAYALGYSDPSHFARAFRRMTGVSPSAYRRERCTPETSDQDWHLARNGQIAVASQPNM